jgi:hypothetical protein
MNVWCCLSPNVGPFHIYPERPGLMACDPAYHAHLKCGEMRLTPKDALVIERDENGGWPDDVIERMARFLGQRSTDNRRWWARLALHAAVSVEEANAMLEAEEVAHDALVIEEAVK